MRKLFLVILSLGIAVSAVAADGGAARLAALGSPGFIMEDAETDTSLYGFGYGAALAGANARSMVSLSPQIGGFLYKSQPRLASNYTYETQRMGVGLEGNGINTGFVVVPSDGMVIAIRPLGYYNFGSGRDYRADGMGSEYNSDVNEYLYAGELEFAVKLTKNLALGALLGYTSHQMLDREEGDRNFDENGVYKPMFELSAALLPDDKEGWNIGFKAGNRTDMDALKPVKGYWTVDEYTYEKAIYSGAFYNNTYYDEDGVTTTKTAWYSNLMCYHANAGISRQGGNDSVSVNIGVQAAPAATEYRRRTYTNDATGATTSAPDITDDLIDFAAGVVFDAAYRVKLGDFSAGIRLDGDSLHVDYGTGLYNIYDGDAQAGVVYTGISGLKIPFELYYDSTWFYFSRNSHDSMISYGASLGAELMVTKEMAVRAGVNGGMMGYMDSRDPMIGTTDNPGMRNIGAGIGAGFKNDGMEANLTLKWDNYSTSPLDTDYYATRTGNALKLVSDIKVYF